MSGASQENEDADPAGAVAADRVDEEPPVAAAAMPRTLPLIDLGPLLGRDFRRRNNNGASALSASRSTNRRDGARQAEAADGRGEEEHKSLASHSEHEKTDELTGIPNRDDEEEGDRKMAAAVPHKEREGEGRKEHQDDDEPCHEDRTRVEMMTLVNNKKDLQRATSLNSESKTLSTAADRQAITKSKAQGARSSGPRVPSTGGSDNVPHKPSDSLTVKIASVSDVGKAIEPHPQAATDAKAPSTQSLLSGRNAEEEVEAALAHVPHPQAATKASETALRSGGNTQEESKVALALVPHPQAATKASKTPVRTGGDTQEEIEAGLAPVPHPERYPTAVSAMCLARMKKDDKAKEAVAPSKKKSPKLRELKSPFAITASEIASSSLNHCVPIFPTPTSCSEPATDKSAEIERSPNAPPAKRAKLAELSDVGDASDVTDAVAGGPLSSAMSSCPSRRTVTPSSAMLPTALTIDRKDVDEPVDATTTPEEPYMPTANQQDASKEHLLLALDHEEATKRARIETETSRKRRVPTPDGAEGTERLKKKVMRKPTVAITVSEIASSSLNRCLPLSPTPTECSGSIAEAATKAGLGTPSIVNFPQNIDTKRSGDGTKCCVMCGCRWPCLKKRSDSDGKTPFIYCGCICSACEATVWVVQGSNDKIKWCQQCLKFCPFALFAARKPRKATHGHVRGSCITCLRRISSHQKSTGKDKKPHVSTGARRLSIVDGPTSAPSSPAKQGETKKVEQGIAAPGMANESPLWSSSPQSDQGVAAASTSALPVCLDAFPGGCSFLLPSERGSEQSIEAPNNSQDVAKKSSLLPVNHEDAKAGAPKSVGKGGVATQAAITATEVASTSLKRWLPLFSHPWRELADIYRRD